MNILLATLLIKLATFQPEVCEEQEPCDSYSCGDYADINLPSGYEVEGY